MKVTLTHEELDVILSALVNYRENMAVAAQTLVKGTYAHTKAVHDEQVADKLYRHLYANSEEA